MEVWAKKNITQKPASLLCHNSLAVSVRHNQALCIKEALIVAVNAWLPMVVRHLLHNSDNRYPQMSNLLYSCSYIFCSLVHQMVAPLIKLITLIVMVGAINMKRSRVSITQMSID